MFQEVPNWLDNEAKENPLGHVGTQGPRFGAKDIRTQNQFPVNHSKPIELDERWDNWSVWELRENFVW